MPLYSPTRLLTAVLIMEPSLVRLDCLIMLAGLFIGLVDICCCCCKVCCCCCWATAAVETPFRQESVPVVVVVVGLGLGARWCVAPHRPTTPAWRVVNAPVRGFTTPGQLQPLPRPSACCCCFIPCRRQNHSLLKEEKGGG